MKTALLILFSFFLLTLSHAQNWAPINSTEQFNYSLGDADVITHSLLVDSVHINEEDSVFYLNRVIAPCDSCSIPNFGWNTDFTEEGGLRWERNQPQFLGLKVTINNGNWLFSDSTMSFSLKPHEPLLNPWQFSENTEALIIEEVEQEVFGELDSVKFIYLSGGQIIGLSKNHGLLSFPQLEGEYEFELQGIEGRQVGELLPDFHSVFDFEVGDIFLRYRGVSNSTSYVGYQDYYKSRRKGIKKQEVTDVMIYEDSVRVTFNTLSNDTISITQYSSELNDNSVPIATANSYDIASITESILYTREDYEQYNRIPKSFQNSNFGFQYKRIEDEKVIQYHNSFFLLDHIYFSTDQFINTLYTYPNYWIDNHILSGPPQLIYGYLYHPFWYLNTSYDPEVNSKSMAYSNGLGKISQYELDHSPGYNTGSEILPSHASTLYSKLLAYEKANGETGGIMLSDSEVLSVSENNHSITKLTLYPNPSQTFMLVECDQRMSSIAVYSQFGKELLTETTASKSHRLDLANLASGIYVLQVTLADGSSYSERFIKKDNT